MAAKKSTASARSPATKERVAPPKTRTRPRKAPKQERSRAMVDTILEAAARVLVAHRFADATTNRIAEEAGISVGSLYQYFPSKDAIVVELLRRHRAAMARVLAEHIVKVAREPLGGTVRELVQAMLDAHGINPKLHRVLVEEVLHRDARREVGDFEERVEDMVRAALEAHKAILRVKHVDVAAFVLVRMMLGVAQAAVVEHPARAKDPRLAVELTDVITRYLVPDA